MIDLGTGNNNKMCVNLLIHTSHRVKWILTAFSNWAMTDKQEVSFDLLGFCSLSNRPQLIMRRWWMSLRLSIEERRKGEVWSSRQKVSGRLHRFQATKLTMSDYSTRHKY